MPQGAPARYPFGIATQKKIQTFGNFPAPYPFSPFALALDFTGLDYLATAWTVTETQAGATQSLVAADAADECGLLALVNTAGAADINSIQLTTAQIFLGNTTRKWWLEGRISRDNADEKMGFGVQAVNATPFTLANAIWAQVNSAATAADFSIAKGSSVTTSSVAAAYGTSALNTFLRLGMFYNGKDRIDCFVDGVKRAEITTLTNLPNTAALLLTVSGMNSSANARTVHCDYVGFYVERP